MPPFKLPYPGLRAFRRDENLLFFGREGCVDAMLTKLADTRFLTVLGSSGSGKSSLVRTGLLNGLERGLLREAGEDWLIADFHPGNRPLGNLAAALTRDTGLDAADALESFLEIGPCSLIEWAQFGNLSSGRSVLIFVDQFEELFRYGDYIHREAAEAFVALLIESAAGRDVSIYVVLTMRSEHLGGCSLLPGLADAINRGLYLTPRMDREACRQAIEGPARVFGFTIEPRLVSAILNDMASFAPFEVALGSPQGQMLSRRADQLPLMQHLLNRLWARAKPTGETHFTLLYDDYTAAGGLIGALDAHGAEVIAALPTIDRPLVETIFRALVTGPDPASAVRRPAPFGALAAETASAASATRIVDAFRTIDCNFLRPESHADLTSDTVVDISHESLIRQWSLLTEWSRQEARADAEWRRLNSSVARRKAGLGGLLTKEDLAPLAKWWDQQNPTQSWAARHGGGYDEVVHFYAESREADKQVVQNEQRRIAGERKRLIWLSISSCTVALVVASLLLKSNYDGRTIAVQEHLLEAQKQERTANEHLLAEQTLALHNAQAELQQARDASMAVTEELKNKTESLRHVSLQLDRQTKDIARNNVAYRIAAFCRENVGEKLCSDLNAVSSPSLPRPTDTIRR